MDFCRVYILYQKWKAIREAKEWEKMDDVMYQLFKRSKDTIKNNETLRQILLPLNSSLLDTLIHISENHIIISETYFNYMKRSDIQEDIVNASYLDTIDLYDTELPDLINDKDEDFDAAYNEFIKTMVNVSSKNLVDLTKNVKSEKQVSNEDEDDDCQIIGVTFGEYSNDKQEICHEILDDDDIEIIYYKKSQTLEEKDTASSTRDTRKKALSFLDSIQLPDTTNFTEETVLSTHSLPSASTQTCLLDDTTDTTSLSKVSQNNIQSDKQIMIPNEVSIISKVQSSTSVECINVVKSELDIQTSTKKLTTPYTNNSKCVTTTETQTDNFSQAIQLDSCRCNKKKKSQNSAQTNVYKDYSYCYGLITPPSDQPSEDHTVSTTESISNVYAKIVRTHNDLDNANGVEECLSSSLESNVLQNPISSNESASFVASVIEKSSITSIIEQNKYVSIDVKSLSTSDNAFDNEGFDEEFEQELESNGLKKNGNLGDTLDLDDVYANPCNSLNNNSDKIVNIESSEKASSVSESYNHDSNFVSDTCSVQGTAEQPPNSPSPPTNVNMKSTTLPYLSPDITSTFVNIQDFNERSSIQEEHVEEQQTTYDNLNSSISEPDDGYLNVSSSQEYLLYSSYDSSDQRKRTDHNQQVELEDGEEHENEIFIADPILMNNSADELSFKQQHRIEGDVNVTQDNHFSESSNHINCSSSSIINHTDNNEIGDPLPTALEVNNVNHNTPQKSNSGFKELKEIVEKVDKIKHNDGVLNKNINQEKLVENQSQKVIFTAPDKLIRMPKDDLSTFRETDLKWQRLEEQHSFEEFTNPISKINGTNYCINPDPNFDLFSSKVSTSSSECITLTPTSNSSANSSIDVISPAYEEIDDFEPYMKNFHVPISPTVQDKVVSPKNKVKKTVPLERNSVSKSEMLAKVFRKNIKSVQSHEDSTHKISNLIPTNMNNEEKHHASPESSIKKMRFAEDSIGMCDTVVHSPLENTNNVLHGILKKASSGITYNQQKMKKQSKHSQNKPSLGHYDVKSNTIIPDSKLQIHLNYLSESKISQLLNANKTAQKVREKKQEVQNSMQEMLRVVYDKQTSCITDNDVVHYITNKSRQDEGTVTSTFNNNNINIPNQYNDSSKNFTTDLSELNISGISSETILSSNSSSDLPFIPPESNFPKQNPFLLQNSRVTENDKKECLQEPDSLNKNADYLMPTNFIKSTSINDEELDKILLSSIIENQQFSNEIHLNINQQPSVVSKVTDYEKTIKLEELNKSSIPCDLDNITLRKFNPSPVISYLGIHSNSSDNMLLPDITLEKPTSEIIESLHIKPQGNHNDFKNVTKSDNLDLDPTCDDNLYCTDLPKTCKNELEINLGIFESKYNNIQPADFTIGIDINERISEIYEDNKSDIFSKIDISMLDTEHETHLPLKKRKFSVTNTAEDMMDDELGPEFEEEIIKRARAENDEKDDISYPAKPMISIAEIQEKLKESQPRIFKTPAERKEMPPSTESFINSLESPKIVTEQYNNHTYNNPTINYHMNNVPYPFFPCATLPYFPPILLPINSRSFDMNFTSQPTTQQQPSGQESAGRSKREKRSRGRKKSNLL